MTLHYNYHTHTRRCGHATGTQEEYVQRAIACGIEAMGFSDHFPLMHPDGSEPWWRIPTSEVASYREETMYLREKYKGQIDISFGFEMEYFSVCFPSMLESALSYGAEYLILGQHYVEPEYLGGRHAFSEQADEEGGLRSYVSVVIDAMKTGVFTYVAHPDVFCFKRGELTFYREEMRRLCAASRELNIPIELNFLGIRSHRHYPREEFWEIAGEEGAPVTFGFDAHDVQGAYDESSLPTAQAMVERYHLHYVGKPRLIPIQKLSGKGQ